MRLDRLLFPLVTLAEHAILRLNRRSGMGRYADPARYFDREPAAIAARCREIAADYFGYLRPPDRGVPTEVTRFRSAARAESHAFPSPLPSGTAANDRVVFHRYRARGPARGAVLFHHPAFRRSHGWTEWFLEPLRRRLDVVVMEAPFHLSRCPAGAWSGEWLVNPNPLLMYQGMRQWLADHRALLALLERWAARGDAAARPLGLVGFSLGGYLSLLHSAFDPRLPVVGIAVTNDYALGVWEGILSAPLVRGIREMGWSRADWEELTRPVKLHPYPERFPAERICLISGVNDQVEPFSSIERFHQALKPRRVVRLASAHLTTGLLRARVMKETLRFLEDLEVW